jgi:hypothetical protein
LNYKKQTVDVWIEDPDGDCLLFHVKKLPHLFKCDSLIFFVDFKRREPVNETHIAMEKNILAGSRLRLKR